MEGNIKKNGFFKEKFDDYPQTAKKKQLDRRHGRQALKITDKASGQLTQGHRTVEIVGIISKADWCLRVA